MKLKFVAVGSALACATALAEEGFEVHDMKRPQPAVVTPGSASTQDQPGKPPSDAIVLFDGKDVSKWAGKNGEAEWKVDQGELVVKPGSGNIQTKDQFADVQLHMEWLIPEGTEGKSQGRGNSGVFFMGVYELQILDCYNNETYPDGSTGAMYGQYPPLANACRPQGQWQVYDVIFRAPKLDENGKVIKPATMTAILNGVVVQDHSEFIGTTAHKALAAYPDKHPAKGPIGLQDHGNPLRFRNIWVRELNPEKPKPAVKPAGEGH